MIPEQPVLEYAKMLPSVIIYILAINYTSMRSIEMIDIVASIPGHNFSSAIVNRFHLYTLPSLEYFGNSGAYATGL